MLCVDCLELGHVDGVRIKGTSCHAGDLAGNGAVVAHGNGIVCSFPGRAGGSALGIGFYFRLSCQILVLGTGGHRMAAQSYTVCQFGLGILADGHCIGSLCSNRTAQARYGVIASGSTAFPKGQGIFSTCYGVFTKSRSIHIDGFRAFPKSRGIVIVLEIITSRRGGSSCLQGHILEDIRRSGRHHGSIRLFGQGHSMDIPMIVLDVRITILPFDHHIIMNFPGRLAVLHILEIPDCIGVAIGILIGFIAVGIDSCTAGQPHGPAGIGLHAGQSIRTEGCGVVAGCNGAIAESRTVLGHGPGPAAKGGGPVGPGLGIGAKGYSIGIFSQGPFPKGQRTPTQGFGPVAKSHGILPRSSAVRIFRASLSIHTKSQRTFTECLSSFSKSYRSNAAGNIPFLFFIISATKGQ